MKIPNVILLLALTLAYTSQAQVAQFFRISGPSASTIIGLLPDGTMVWTNNQPGGTYTVQSASLTGGATNWVDYVQIPSTPGANTNRILDFNPPAGMAFIPAGSFTMGNCMVTNEGSADELPLHTVSVSAFYMEKFEVTKALWDEVYNWATNHGYSFLFAGYGRATNQPVSQVDWFGCVKWCNARSQRSGLTPVYYRDAALTQVYTNGEIYSGSEQIYAKWTAQGYRLPTEAEWEKAARGGQSGRRFPWGNTISWSQANYYAYPAGGYTYDANPTEGYHPTFYGGFYPFTNPGGYFAPNGYGLLDMAGNQLEWCWDRFDAVWYGNPAATQNDTRGPNGNFLSSRVMRGGDWGDYAYYARSACRYPNGPSGASLSYGFRCVRGQ